MATITQCEKTDLLICHKTNENLLHDFTSDEYNVFCRYECVYILYTFKKPINVALQKVGGKR